MLNRLLSALWFHIAWLACVYAALHDLGAWTLTLIPISLYLLSCWHPLTKARLWVLFQMAVIGMSFDLVASNIGLIHFSQTVSFFPIWLVSLWGLFACALPLSAQWQIPLWLQAILGALFGPLSYLSGKAFGVLDLNGMSALFAYSVFWGLYFPFSIHSLREPKK